MKEFIRKSLVSLKRKPQTIAFLVLIAAFVYYSLNLTTISNTTAYVQGSGMGLAGFVIMLLSVLLLVCFLNAYPRRKKPNVLMLGLMYGMIACVLAASFIYNTRIEEAIQANFYRGAFDYVSTQVGTEQTRAITEAATNDAIAQGEYLSEYGISVPDRKALDTIVADAKSVNADAASREKAAHAEINDEYERKALDITVEENLAMQNDAAFAKKYGPDTMAVITKVLSETKATTVDEVLDALNGVTTDVLAENGVFLYDVEAVAALLTPGEDGLVSAENSAKAERMLQDAEKTREKMLKDAGKLFKKMVRNIEKRITALEKPRQQELNAASDQALVDAVTEGGFAQKYGVDLEGMKTADVRLMMKTAAELQVPQPSAEALYMKAKEMDVPAEVFTEADKAGVAASEKILAERPYIQQAQTVINIHRILLLAGAALALLLPVYAPLIRKINTSVEVEANGDMGEIELDNSDD